jgi:hypothetical protein
MTQTGYTGYTGSTYPSGQIGDVKRHVIPGFGASDIWQGAPVCLASSGDWTFQMVTSAAQKPVGIARDFAAAGQPVSVYDDGNIQRTYPGAGGSFSRQAYVGYVGTSSGVHPVSGVTVTYPVLGQVAGTPSVAVGASSAAVWAVGVAYESAALNDQAAFRVEPRLLSGLVTS